MLGALEVFAYHGNAVHPTQVSEGGLSVGCMTLGWLCGSRGWSWLCHHPDVLISQLPVPGHLHPSPVSLSMWGCLSHLSPCSVLPCKALGTLLLPFGARPIPSQPQHCFLLELQDVHQHQESERFRPCTLPCAWPMGQHSPL